MSILEKLLLENRCQESSEPAVSGQAAERDDDAALCPTCLARGRAVSPLRDVARAYCALLTGIHSYEQMMDFATTARVCWECRTFLGKVVKFQEQVIAANSLLLSRAAVDKREALQSFTSLACSTKVGFNYTFEHQRTKESREDTAAPEQSSVDWDAETNPSENTFGSELEGQQIGKHTQGGEQLKPKKKQTPTKRKYVKKKRWPTTNVLLKGDNRNARVVSVNMNEEQFLKYRDEDRKSDEYLRAPHKCDDCVKSFSFVSMLEKHRTNYHSEDIGPHKCNICSMRFADAEQLARHRRRHYKLYVCTACGFPHRKLPLVLRHYDAAHEPGRTYPCDRCARVFQSYRKMHYHRDATHKDIYRCQYCSKILSNVQSLKSHLLIHTGMPTLECSICRKSCRGESGLDAHMRTAHNHESAEEAYCKECDIQFKSKKIYKVHLKQSPKHNPPTVFKFSCDKCDKKFITEAKLKHHHRTYHLDYVCRVCQKRLANGLSLDQHIKTVHEGRQLPRKHVCELCGKAFKNKSMLSEHRNVHTGERPHACAACGARFAQRSTLHTHQKLIHLKVRRERAPPPTEDYPPPGGRADDF